MKLEGCFRGMFAIHQNLDLVRATIMPACGDLLKWLGFLQNDRLPGLEAEVFPFENLGGGLAVGFHVVHGVVDYDILLFL